MPVLTFTIKGTSPLYSWSWPTAAGLLVVTAFLLLETVRVSLLP
ncbi:hypothetical protein [Mesorhizobium sp. 1M-11]|nr:hypothetical protein [Mesorhizobium sp. 1M-11]